MTVPRRSLIAACLLPLVVVSGCTSKTLSKDDAPDAPPELVLLHSGVSHGGAGGRTIDGVVRNDAQTTYHYVQIEFDLYDKAGHGVGSTLAKTSDLGPGQTWNFRAPVLKKQAYRYRMDDLTGY